MKHYALVPFIVMLGIATPALAQTQDANAMAAEEATGTQPAAEDDGGGRPMFGRQLMSAEERAAHRARMRAAATDEERARLRAEHHQQMLERARERGVTLPEEPPMRGPGAGDGSGRKRPQQAD